MADIDLVVTDEVAVQVEEVSAVYVPIYWNGRTIVETKREQPFPGKYMMRPVNRW